MPFLRFKGFEKKILQQIAPDLVAEFSHIANVPKEIVKIELVAVEQITDHPPSLEILMFPREKETHDRLASRLHAMVSEYGYSHVHIFFILLNHSLYYKEGSPLAEIPSVKQPSCTS
ncbi:DUF1904 family protein [Aneurinibacillus tyrosinisolvens]|uniref:DUF1904 family protein n=1 Tax=Aneurinibacillus tyrosinisolvens TaxID=1443435 RepID=UPI00063EF011|nr:DUF1904 family protein [Aneurinibacillus tyrosinisolvens]